MAVRSVEVRLEANVAKYMRDITLAGTATEKAFSRVHTSTARSREEFVQIDRSAENLRLTLRRTESGLDSYTARLGLVTRAALAVAPAFPAIGAAAVPALTSVANLLGITTVAAGVSAIALQGVGDAAKALQKAQLTGTAQDIAEAERQLRELAPEAADFVIELNRMIPALKEVRDSAAGGLFPGASEALGELDDALPRIEQFAAEYGAVVGDLLASGAEDLTSGRWTEFVNFLEGEARPTLTSLAHVVGDVAHGASEMWMALDPVGGDFLGGLEKGANVFDKWASGLQGSEGLENFLAYVQETGPEVVDTALSLAEAVIAIGQAAAPLSGPVLDGIQALADVVGTIADSPLGGAVVGFAATSSVAGLAKQGFSSAAASPVGQGITETIANVKDLASAFKDTSKAEEESAEASAGNAEEKASLADQVSDAAEKAGELTGANEEAAAADNKATAATTKNTSAQKSRAQALKQSAAALGKQAALMGGVMLASSGAADGLGLASTATYALTGAMIGGGLGAAIGGGVGLLMDLKNAGQAAGDAIRDMEDAIDSGDLETMQAQLDAFRERNEKYLDGDWTFGDTLTSGWKDLISFGGLSAELETVNRLVDARDAAREAQLDYNDALSAGGRAAYEAKYGIDKLVESMGAQQAAARAALDNQFAWGQAVQGIRQLVKDGSEGFDEFTEAGQNNFAAISQAADALNSMVEAGDLTNREYVKLRKQFIDFAEDLGAGRREAEHFANELLDFPDALAPQIGIQFDKQQLQEAKEAFDSLPREVRSEIKADGIPKTEAEIDALVEKYELTEKDRSALLTLKDQASARIQDVLALLRQYRDKNITVTTTFQNFYKGPKKDPGRSNPGLGLLNPKYSATGGPIYGPGSATSDSIPAMLSNGEYVIQAAAVDKYGVDLFDRLNSMVAGHRDTLALASGGATGSWKRKAA